MQTQQTKMYFLFISFFHFFQMEKSCTEIRLTEEKAEFLQAN